MNEAVSRHYADPIHAQSRTQERTHDQAQALDGLAFMDKVMFARIRGEIPGHVSDAHVMQAMTAAKANGVRDASDIGSVMMLGDSVRVAGAGEAGNTVMVDVTRPAQTLQASIDAASTLDRQQAQTLAQQQSQPTQNEPGRPVRMA